ncbi:hypothetical protein JHK82_013901 [Glycine max]|nr:hypothetical protein JHK82_013901 [Glycine max]
MVFFAGKQRNLVINQVNCLLCRKRDCFICGTKATYWNTSLYLCVVSTERTFGSCGATTNSCKLQYSLFCQAIGLGTSSGHCLLQLSKRTRC